MAKYLGHLASLSATGWETTEIWRKIILVYETQYCHDSTPSREGIRGSSIAFQFDERELDGRQILKVVGKKNIGEDRPMCVVVLEVLGDDNSVTGSRMLEESVVYRYLKGLDKGAPERESFGILALDRLCLLFRVVGDGPPETLIGGPKELINILDEGASPGIERIMKKIMESARLCRFKTDSDKFVIDTSLEPIRDKPPRSDSPTIVSCSGVDIRVVGPFSSEDESNGT